MLLSQGDVAEHVHPQGFGGAARRWGHHQVVTVIGGGAPRSVPRFIAAVTVIRSSASYSCRVHDGRVVGSGLTSPAPGCRQRGTAANPPPPVPAGCRRRRSRSTHRPGRRMGSPARGRTRRRTHTPTGIHHRWLSTAACLIGAYPVTPSIRFLLLSVSSGRGQRPPAGAGPSRSAPGSPRAPPGRTAWAQR